MNIPAKILELRSNNPLLANLQDELLSVIDLDKYDNLSMASIVGVLEFLKWNLINRSN